MEVITLSRYTTELRYILLNPDWTDERLGLTDYPLFDNDYRQHLNNLIKDYFYFDEIGQETPARFAHRLRTKMEVIMPYYNQLYNSAKVSIDPFITMRYNIKGNETLRELLKKIRDLTRDVTDHGSNDNEQNSTTTTTTHDTQKDTEGGTQKDDSKTGVRESKHGDDKVSHDGDNQHIIDQQVKSTDGGDETVKVTYDSDVYDHGFDVHSDTPEGFMLTDTIERDTYATTADKHRNRTEKDGTDTTDTTYGKTNNTDTDATNRDVFNSSDTTTYNSGVDTDTNYEDTITFGKTLDKVSWGTTETVGNVTSHGTNDNIINEIIKEVENSERNLNRDTLTQYDGFSSTTMSEMLLKWRSTFINIDQQILKELEPLFIGVLN